MKGVVLIDGYYSIITRRLDTETVDSIDDV